MKIKILPHEYAALYREYFNNFLTKQRFAEYTGFHVKKVNRMLNKGYVLHNDIFGNQ